MERLKIVLFCDGRPGHEKQSRGIIKALEKYIEVDVSEVLISRKSLVGSILDHLKFFLHLDDYPEPEEGTDLLVAAGSQTHIPILACKRRSGARAVVCMSPSRLLRNRFDLCFVPIHDRLPARHNIVSTIGPPNIASSAGAGDPARGLILVGGIDNSSHRWEEETLLSEIEELLESASVTSWVISSSPRTPKETERKLEALTSRFPQAAFYPFQQTTPGWIEKQYRETGVAWITADSISMVYEALSAGCRVGILPVRWKKENNKFRFSEQYLAERQLVVTFKQWRAGESKWPDTKPLDEADHCARELLRRWWPKNLP